MPRSVYPLYSHIFTFEDLSLCLGCTPASGTSLARIFSIYIVNPITVPSHLVFNEALNLSVREELDLTILTLRIIRGGVVGKIV